MTSQLRVDRISPANGSEIIIDGFSGGEGNIIQVVSKEKNDTFSTNSLIPDFGGQYVPIDGLTLSITPSSASSKILISWMINVSTSADHSAQCKIVRNGTAIGVPSTGSSTGNACSFMIQNRASDQIVPFSGTFLDSPSNTSETEYSFWVASTHATNTILVNGMNGVPSYKTISTATLMEVAG